jgi:hypothetical protein
LAGIDRVVIGERFKKIGDWKWECFKIFVSLSSSRHPEDFSPKKHLF